MKEENEWQGLVHKKKPNKKEPVALSYSKGGDGKPVNRGDKKVRFKIVPRQKGRSCCQHYLVQS